MEELPESGSLEVVNADSLDLKDAECIGQGSFGTGKQYSVCILLTTNLFARTWPQCKTKWRGDWVAVKVVDYSSNTLRELEMLATLRSPYLVSSPLPPQSLS